jgi:hypothetical protein
LGLAVLLAINAKCAAQAQPDSGTIYGVMALDVPPGAANPGATLLRQYREGGPQAARKYGCDAAAGARLAQQVHCLRGLARPSRLRPQREAAPSAELAGKLKAMSATPFDRRDYQVISVGPARPTAAGDVIYMELHLDVFPPGIDPTVAAAKVVAEAAAR